MKNISLSFLSGLCATCLLAVSLVQAATSAERPTIIVAPQAQVSGGTITLGDISRIIYEGSDKAEKLAQLQEIPLGESPRPKGTTTITGARLLEIIGDAGIDLNAIAYSVPQAIQIERLGRTIQSSELLQIVRDKIARDTTYDLQVREVHIKQAQIVPVGDSSYEVQLLGEPLGGKVPVRVTASVDGKPAARFLATAVVDDWREVPVLRRGLERGMLIMPDDIEVVRLNLFKQPRDIASDSEQVIGKRAKSNLRAGEVIRKSTVDIPPLVARGKQVVMIYEKGFLRATATGKALDDGLEGEVIGIQNSASKKSVKGKIISAEEVVILAE